MPLRLTVNQENLVRELVKLDHEDLLDETFSFIEVFGGGGFNLHKAQRTLECDAKDVRALSAAGLIDAQFFGVAEANCSLRPEAADAVRSDFGGSRRRRFLNALHDLAGGKPLYAVPEEDVAKRAKLSIDDLRDVYLVLANERKVGGNSGGGKGPLLYLEPAGIREVERGGHLAPAPARTTFIQNFHAHKSAVNIGDNNTATLNVLDSHAELTLLQIKEQNERMLLQHEAIRTVLEDLTAAVATGTAKDDPRFSEKLARVLEAGKAYAELGKSILDTIPTFMGGR